MIVYSRPPRRKRPAKAKSPTAIACGAVVIRPKRRWVDKAAPMSPEAEAEVMAFFARMGIRKASREPQ